MATIDPINLIEIVDGAFHKKAQVVGSKVTVEEVVNMHLRNGLSIDWIVENYDLNYAQVYAALAYYYSHQEDIDAAIRRSEKLIEENTNSLRILIDKKKTD